MITLFIIAGIVAIVGGIAAFFALAIMDDVHREQARNEAMKKFIAEINEKMTQNKEGLEQ